MNEGGSYTATSNHRDHNVPHVVQCGHSYTATTGTPPLGGVAYVA